MTKIMVLQFAPFASQVSSSFWASLAKVKVDQLQLSQDNVQVLGQYTVGRSVTDRTTGEEVALPVALLIDGEALETASEGSDTSVIGTKETSKGYVNVVGQVKNFNTVEDFKKADKSAILDGLGQELLDIIRNDPEPLSKLNKFTVLSFADLKKFKFIYWFAYPALLSQPSWQVCSKWREVSTVYNDEQVSQCCSVRKSFHP
jgi:ubiquitin-like modifier-activating enzyme ATG7